MHLFETASVVIGPLAEAAAIHRAGDVSAAVDAYRRLIAADPTDAEAMHLLGLGMLQATYRRAAITLIRRALRLRPGTTPYVVNLAVALHLAGDRRRALDSLDALLKRDPFNVAVLERRARMLHQTGQIEAADRTYRACIAIRPDVPDRYILYCDLLRESGQLRPALINSLRAVRLAPDDFNAVGTYADCLTGEGRLTAAVAAYDRALAINPQFVKGLSNRGLALLELGRLDSAADSHRAALRLQPGFAPPWLNLAGVLLASGDALGAAKAARHAANVLPPLPQAHRNLLLSQLYDPDCSHAERYEAHRRFEREVAYRLYPRQPVRFENVPDARRRLRIGYLSADLRSHVVARLMLPMLQTHDRNQVEIFCYATAARSDAVTEQLKAASDHWRALAGRDDATIAATIRKDQIDILVIVAIHFDQNRPLVAAHRAAPIQISHDVATSGLEAIDYILVDPRLLPRRSGELFVERPVRIPKLYIWAHFDDSPPVVPPPVLTQGTLTFGSFNNAAKLTEATLALWARVLKAVPDSRLTLKYRNSFVEPAVRRRIVSILGGHGIEESRLNLLGSRDSIEKHLQLYEGIDIALDPTPFSGSNTSFEAMWMGVPVVTMPTDSMVGRWTGMMLESVGLADLVAKDADQYVELCRNLAADDARLAQLRTELRDRIIASPLCDGRSLTRRLERAYRAMWGMWCKSVLRPALAGVGPEKLIEQGIDLQQQARRWEAELRYRLALRQTPSSIDGWNNLGVLYRQRNQPELAERAFRRQVRLIPDQSGPYSALGVALRDLGRHEEAEAVYRRALLLEPDSWRPHYNLGNMLRALGRLAESARHYRLAMLLNPVPMTRSSFESAQKALAAAPQ